MVSICAVPYHVWTRALWSHLSQVLNVFMSKFPDICIIPYLSLFPEINFVWKATFTKKILSPGSIISQEVAIPGKSDIPGSHISWEVTFPRKSSKISREVTFPGNSHFSQIFQEAIHFPESLISLEVSFPRKTHFPEISREVIFPGSHTFPGSQISRKVTRYPWSNLK